MKIEKIVIVNNCSFGIKHILLNDKMSFNQFKRFCKKNYWDGYLVSAYNQKNILIYDKDFDGKFSKCESDIDHEESYVIADMDEWFI